MKIDLVGDLNQLPEEFKPRIREIFSRVKSNEKLSGEIEVTLSLVSDDEIQSLNKEYRGKDEPTDVLSFPLFSREELREVPEDFPLTLGDIVISLDRASQQAKDYNHSLLREFCFLALHGLLHLLGYNHDTAEGEAEMFSYQNKLLEEYGLER